MIESIALLALAATSAPAETLVIAEVANFVPRDQILRPLFVREDGHWRDAGEAITAAVAAGRLREPGRGKFTAEPIARVPRADFIAQFLTQPMDLPRWYGLNGPRVLVETSVGEDAVLSRRYCNERWGQDEWGLVLQRPMPVDGIVANRPFEVFDFVPEPGSALEQRDPEHGEWRLATDAEESAAIANYRRSAVPRGSSLALPQSLTVAGLPFGWESQSADLGARGSLVWMAGYRPLISREAPPDTCTGPTLVYSALFHVTPDGTPHRVDSFADVQDCEPGWRPRRQPRSLLHVDGEFLLLQSDFESSKNGTVSSGEGLYAVDGTTWKPAAVPLVRRVPTLCSNPPNPLPEQ